MTTNAALNSYALERDMDGTIYLSFVVYGGVSVSFLNPKGSDPHVVTLSYEEGGIDTEKYYEFSKSYAFPSSKILEIEFDEVMDGVSQRDPRKPKTRIED